METVRPGGKLRGSNVTVVDCFCVVATSKSIKNRKHIYKTCRNGHKVTCSDTTAFYVTTFSILHYIR